LSIRDLEEKHRIPAKMRRNLASLPASVPLSDCMLSSICLVIVEEIEAVQSDNLVQVHVDISLLLVIAAWSKRTAFDRCKLLRKW
jgi:hypothetical protein